MTHDEALEQVRQTLGQMIEDGDVPDEGDFERIRQSYADAMREDDRAHFESLTWDEVRADLWE